jgi:hypothetical protein
MDMKMNMLVVVFALFIILPMYSMAADVQDNDVMVSPSIELGTVITLLSSIMATALFILTVIAYRRDGHKRLFFVSLAFFLFAVKGFLLSSDIFFPSQNSWVDPIANFLDFAVLLCFFVGLAKK